MSAIEGLLESYKRHVSRPWDASLAGDQKVWFVVYDPAQERRLRLRFPAFEAATRAAERKWVHIDLTNAFADWMVSQRHRDRYFAKPEALVYKLSDFRQDVAARIREALTDADVDDQTVVAVSGIASLFGLVRVSEVIDDVGGDIRGRLAVFFPGSYDEKSYFRLLDARDGWDYLAVPIIAS